MCEGARVRVAQPRGVVLQRHADALERAEHKERLGDVERAEARCVVTRMRPGIWLGTGVRVSSPEIFAEMDMARAMRDGGRRPQMAARPSRRESTIVRPDIERASEESRGPGHSHASSTLRRSAIFPERCSLCSPRNAPPRGRSATDLEVRSRDTSSVRSRSAVI